MALDPMETVNSASEDTSAHRDRKAVRLSNSVAITVALIATFLGVCTVKDGNIVQAMQQAQADKLDHWNFYQARNIRQEIAQAELTQLSLSRSSQPAAGATAAQPRTRTDSAIARYVALVKDQATKKDSLRVQAEQDQKNYDALNYRDDQFDLSDALVAIAISLLAVTALTQKRWLFWMALVPTAFGVLFGLAGLMGWRLHSDMIARLLS